MAHAAAAGWEAVRLRYDDALAADVIVPTRDIHALGPAELWEAGRALDASAPEMVDLTMPTLKLTARTDLLAALPGVDLSDLSGIFSGPAPRAGRSRRASTSARAARWEPPSRRWSSPGQPSGRRQPGRSWSTGPTCCGCWTRGPAGPCSSPS
ncbi:serpin family protein [Tessaracoccus defluvii]|uniref:hypothetical protein n=1 Tax=Tessaracoccus defluvii TaxID=1285901 RepID=UPI001D0543CA|nr:hypothetical protein [Tessaracoccus defluvii]